MKIKFIVDMGEHLEGDVVELADELAEEHLEANHAISIKAPESKYAALNVKELDALLEERDLEAGGKKGEKVARLEVDDDLTIEEDSDEDEEDSEDEDLEEGDSQDGSEDNTEEDQE